MPFYAQADLVTILPFGLGAVIDIVDEGFASTGRDAGRLGATIHGFTGGHPHRTMQLADAAWRAAEPGKPYGDHVWEAALAAVRANTDLANETVYSGFGTSEKTVLRLLASGESLFGAASDLLGLSAGSAQNAREKLLASGDITESGSNLVVVDPLFADWVRRRLPVY
jgi:uncharacterized protein